MNNRMGYWFLTLLVLGVFVACQKDDPCTMPTAPTVSPSKHTFVWRYLIVATENIPGRSEPLVKKISQPWAIEKFVSGQTIKSSISVPDGGSMVIEGLPLVPSHQLKNMSLNWTSTGKPEVYFANWALMDGFKLQTKKTHLEAMYNLSQGSMAEVQIGSTATALFSSQFENKSKHYSASIVVWVEAILDPSNLAELKSTTTKP